MSNREKAVQVIRRQTLVSDMHTARDVARRLDQAGLLAPDLPEPNDPNIIVADGKSWLLDGPDSPVVWTVKGGRVMVQRIEPGNLTPDEARDFAHAVLAAANYSEDTE